MLIYLEHKDHGTHIAYSETEAKVCEGNGWVRRKEAKPKKRMGRPPKVKHD